MRRLADQTGQTANLGILDNYQVVHIEVVAPDRPVRFWASIGKREDANVSGLGKMLLAGIAPDALESYLEQSRVAIMPKTIIDATQLDDELDRIRAQGYAIDDQESNVGVMCIAAPIFEGSGRMMATVSISSPRAEFEADSKTDKFVSLVQAAAKEISIRLGWTPNHS